eukprot:scaffold69412_cov36-Cyclotella_meneghiniana.AAC.1
MLRASGKLKNVARAFLFEKCSSITSDHLILRILLTDLWMNTSSLSKADSFSAHDSHPHNRRLIGMARKNRFLRAPMLLLAVEMRCWMSGSSIRLYEAWDPRFTGAFGGDRSYGHGGIRAGVGSGANQPGVGKYTHSVLLSISPLPMCISKPKFSKAVLIRASPFIRSALDWKMKAPSSMYNISISWKMIPLCRV